MLLIPLSFLWLLSVPEWLESLKPQSELGLGYIERLEDRRKVSGFESRAHIHLPVQFSQEVEIGTELRLRSSGDDRAYVNSQNGFEDFSLGISQLYIAYRFQGSPDQDWILSLGKFTNPLPASSLSWDPQLRPEGFYQGLSLRFPKDLIVLRLHGGQFNADRSMSDIQQGLPMRRSWIFTQGMDLEWTVEKNVLLNFSLLSYFFYDPSERMVRESARLGSESVVSNNAPIRFAEKFSPLEFTAAVRTNPLGIPAKILGAGIINFRSGDQARGLTAELHIGESWKKSGAEAQVAWRYLEPNAQVAWLTDSSWGYANRHGGRGRFYFGLRKNVRTMLGFLYAATLNENDSQANRIEARLAVEARWP